MKNLKKDPEIIITPADKGKALVIMDRKEYIKKMEEKLNDTTTYMKIDKDPIMEIKKELASEIQELLKEEIINKNLHRQLYPNTTQIPRAYGSPKIQKEGYPLREIVEALIV